MINAMIKIIADFRIQSNQAERFLSYAAELIRCSRQEAGCISYALYRELEHQNSFTFIEEWESPEAIALHNQSAHFRDFCEKVKSCQVGTANIAQYREVDC